MTAERLAPAGAQAAGPHALSRRELEVVWELAGGRRAADIAAKLHISRNTVRSHVRNAMVKTGARSQAHLVAIALVAGVFERDSLSQIYPGVAA